MKVLNVAARLSSEWGGPAKVATDLTKALAKKGIEVSIFATTGGDESLRIDKHEGVDVRFFQKGVLSKWWPSYPSPLAKALMERISDFDLIHIHEIWHYPNFAAYTAAKRAGKAYVVTIHGALQPWCLKHKALKKRIYASLIQRRILSEATGLHALTQQEVKDIQNFGIETPITVIPNGIDPEEFQVLPLGKTLESSYPELNGKKVMLFLGRIHPIKGLDILAKALGKVAIAQKDTYLVIAGPDNESYQAEVVKILESEGIINKVIFAGMLDGREKLAAFSRADVIVLSSYSEGFAMSILEAMACKVPLIITRQCGFPEVAVAGAGFIVEPEPDQLTEALLDLLGSQELCNEMGEKGKRLVTETYNWDKILDKMINFYEEILGNRKVDTSE